MRGRSCIVSRTFLAPLAAGLSSSSFLGIGAVNNDEHQEHEKHNLHVCLEAEEQWKQSLRLSAEYTCGLTNFVSRKRIPTFSVDMTLCFNGS